jgi:cellobiose PTS system EIIC component
MKAKNYTLNKFQVNLQHFMGPVAEKMNGNNHLSALKEGLSMTIPLIIVGSIFLIIAQPPVDATKVQATNIFLRFLLKWHSWAVANKSVLLLPYNLTLGLLAVYAVVGISYSLAEKYNMDRINTALSALFVFLAVSVKIDKVNLDMTNLGAAGLFTAIIVGLVTVDINHFLLKKNLKIKMPEQVPAMVSAPFEALIPTSVNLLIFMAINGLLSFAGTSIPGLMITLLRPILWGANTLPAILLLTFITSFLWFFGIHGDNVTSPIVMPIITANVALNAAAVAAGKPMTAILSGYFMSIFGGWCTCPAMLISFFMVAKSVRLKSLSKVGLVPDLFNINEPFVFGTPLVMNISLMIPELLLPLLNITIAYFATAANLVGHFYILAPWTVPGIIGAFLCSMDWRASVLWVILCAIDVIVWIPFVKSYDILLQKEESKNDDSKID